MAKDRTAIDTIRGYYYQFDLYALRILESSGEKIVLEGIEDVDVRTATETTAIQCKYYEGTSYDHSVIAKPIRWMLKHFSEHRTENFKYHLHGYYKDGQKKLVLPLTVDFVKDKFFTYTEKKTKVKHEYHKELSLTNDEILQFTGKLSININAYSFKDQYSCLLSKIQATWKCDSVEAECHYYPIILKMVREIATDKDIANRTVTKDKFLEKIDSCKKPLFDIWYAQKLKKEEYHKQMHKLFFSPRGNISPFERFFLIECDDKIADVDIKYMVHSICRKWSKISQREPIPFVPYVFLGNLTPKRMANIKRMLHDDGLIINDGQPFHSSPFYIGDIIRKPKPGDELIIKIIDDSNMIDGILDALSGKTREIYQFYRESPCYDTNKYKMVSICVESTDEVVQIV